MKVDSWSHLHLLLVLRQQLLRQLLMMLLKLPRLLAGARLGSGLLILGAGKCPLRLIQGALQVPQLPRMLAREILRLGLVPQRSHEPGCDCMRGRIPACHDICRDMALPKKLHDKAAGRCLRALDVGEVCLSMCGRG